jgi:hypothetical protein
MQMVHVSKFGTTVTEAMTNGRSEPVRASPNASTARRSASTALWKSPGERDVVVESEVDHAIRRPGGSAQAGEIVQIAAMYSDPGLGEGSGRGVGAGRGR